MSEKSNNAITLHLVGILVAIFLAVPISLACSSAEKTNLTPMFPLPCGTCGPLSGRIYLVQILPNMAK